MAGVTDAGYRAHSADTMKIRIAFVLAALVLAARPLQAQKQQPPPAAEEEPLATEEDPTKAVFLSFREEYTNGIGDAWNTVTIVRSDRVFLKNSSQVGGKLGWLTRADLPVVVSNPGNGTQGGLGDLYLQALYVPYLTRGFAFAAGTGMNLPTATDATLGNGKWQVAPMVVPVWFFKRGRGFFYVRVQEHVSFAGDSGRNDINFSEIVPTVLRSFKRRWWFLADTNVRTDWARGRVTSFRSGLEIGRVMTPHFGLSVKPEIPWGPNRTAEYTLKVILTRYKDTS
jgi:hypothetical protein